MTSSRLKRGFKIIDATGSHHNGKHVLGLSPGNEDAHEEEPYDPEEEAMMRDVVAEEEKNNMESKDADVGPWPLVRASTRLCRRE